MEGSRRFVFLFLVFFFSGSMVLIGTHDLRRHTMQKADGAPDEARLLISHLRGESLKPSKEGIVNPESVPQRKPGDYLQHHDKKKLNSLIHQLIPPNQEQ